MKIEDYIIGQITKHSTQHDIKISHDLLNQIVDSVKSGNLAFRLIWTTGNVLSQYSPLDLNKIKTKKTNSGILYSFDSGKRFQWSDRETLIIDISPFRDFKLNLILNEI